MKLIMYVGLIIVGWTKGQNLPSCPPTGIFSMNYPGSCTQFVRCVNGNPSVQNCPPGLAFDIVYGDCTTADFSSCPTANPCLGNGPSDLTFVRHPVDCSSFITCIGPSPFDGQCAPGFYFSLISNTCDNSAVVDCSPLTTTTTFAPGPGDPDLGPGPGPDPGPGPSTDAECNPQTIFEIIASPNSCERFTICTCGTPHVENCPTGLIYDVASQSCNTRVQGHCLSESFPSCPPGQVVEIAHPYDCKYFVRCILGVPTISHCATGLEMNRQTNQCDFPHIAQCT